jgi:hypothetical protein
MIWLTGAVRDYANASNKKVLTQNVPFIVSPSMPDLSHRKLVSACTSRARGNDKRDSGDIVPLCIAYH